MAENPKVTSKFDRMHGHPRVPGHVSKPGGTASPGSAKSMPIPNRNGPYETGAKVKGHTEHGHRIPVHETAPYKAPEVTHHAPHAGRMHDGERVGKDPKTENYDKRKGDGKHG